MFINQANQKRVNIYAPFVDAQGNRHRDLTNPETRAAVGVVEFSEPAAPEDYSEELYFRNESEDAPYVTYTPKPQAMVDTAHNEKILAQIEEIEMKTKMNRTIREDMIERYTEKAMLAFNTPDPAVARQLAYAANVAYRMFIDTDQKISDLRAQLRP